MISKFRVIHSELLQLRILTGTKIPWGLFSATFPSHVFNACHRLVNLGQQLPFWGIDLGADRPNIAQWVRPMEFPARSYASLFAFVPDAPAQREDLPKTIFYFKTRRQARDACRTLRRLLPSSMRRYLCVFTASYFPEYKEKMMEESRLGRIRWFFCTDAAGMGCDIPDVIWVVLYGIMSMASALQKQGRAVLDPTLLGTTVWLVEDWVFDPGEVGRIAGRGASQAHIVPYHPSTTAE